MNLRHAAAFARLRAPYLWRIGVAFVVMGFFAVRYHKEVQRERYSRARSDISVLQTDLKHFQIDYGHYPTTREGLQTLLNSEYEDPGFVLGMAARHLFDPWGKPYFYQSDGENYVLGSFGPHRGSHPDPDLLVGAN